MLVLTRKVQEQIQIGENITISVLRVKGNSVRIGIQAPRDVRVTRRELPPLEETDSVTKPMLESISSADDESIAGSTNACTNEDGSSRMTALRRFRLSNGGRIRETRNANRCFDDREAAVPVRGECQSVVSVG